MSESMVKRLARALEEIAAKSCYTNEEGIIDGVWDSEKFARAVLLEIREPTDKMLHASDELLPDLNSSMISHYVWKAMVKAALKDES